MKEPLPMCLRCGNKNPKSLTTYSPIGKFKYTWHFDCECAELEEYGCVASNYSVMGEPDFEEDENINNLHLYVDKDAEWVVISKEEYNKMLARDGWTVRW